MLRCAARHGVDFPGQKLVAHGAERFERDVLAEGAPMVPGCERHVVTVARRGSGRPWLLSFATRWRQVSALPESLEAGCLIARHRNQAMG